MDARADITDWHLLSQEERDSAFNNSAAIKDSASIVAEWDRRSAAMRASYPEHIGIEYGPGQRNRIDFLKAKAGGPTLLFIHGGYWQTRAKENFTFCAAGPMAHGINVALIGYTLAPDATLDQIVAEIRSGIDALTEKLPSLGGNSDKIIASGWSAGAHLSSMVLDHPRVKAALLISGVYDLEPIRHTYLNAKLGLDEAAARRNSPLLQYGGSASPVTIAAGDAELPVLRRQSAEYAAHRAKQHLPVTYEEIAEANHFTIMEELASPEGQLTTLIRRLL